MSQLWAVILAKCRMAGHQIAGVRHESKLKVGVITVAAVGLWLGAYFLFSAGFGFLIQFGGRGAGEFNFGDLLMSRMLGILALSVFMLLIFSNVLVAFSTMYRSREVAYLVQSPVPFESLFYMRFLESLAFSSWSLAFLGSPLMLAYGVRTEAPLVFYAANLAFFLPFVIIPACIGCVITMALAWVFPRLRMPVVAAIALAALTAFFMIIRYTIRRTRMAEDAVLPAFLDATARMQSPFLPSHWASQGILSAAQGNVSESLVWLLVLLSTAMMSLWVCGRVARRILHPGWSYLAGQDRKREKPMGKGILGRVEQWARPLHDPYRALAVKDVKLFWRDATQWSQFVIFFGIMAVYIANLRNTSRFYEQEMWRSIIANLNVGSVSLILATLT
ncbi:MAG TPA: hypothetical protein ENN65_07895, partial [Candidatus Hydrogenedentes bacterium]|nr:hypothetical protein [Candidatus Hydrogenedentota bacterium]